MARPENTNRTEYKKIGDMEVFNVGGIPLVETGEDKAREGSDRWEHFYGKPEEKFTKD